MTALIDRTRRSAPIADAPAGDRSRDRATPHHRTHRVPSAPRWRKRSVPDRPRRAAHRSADTAALPSAIPASSAVPPAPTTALPSRRSVRGRSQRRGSVLRGAGISAARALAAVTGSVVGFQTMPVTASAVVACLVVTVSTPGVAVAAPVAVPARPVSVQHYVARTGADVPVARDDFAVRDDFSRDPRSGRPLPAVRPVDGAVPTAGGFGSRHVAGCEACSTDHHGLDFAAPFGQPVLAAVPGTVVAAGPLGGYGNQVLLAHPDGSRTRYGHMSRLDVQVGQRVDAGEQIGTVGNTGVSTGPHLHFEVILGATPVDPAPWLAARDLL